MVLSLRLTPKQPQLYNVQTVMLLAVQRNQVNLRLCQGHKYLKQERKVRVVGREQFLLLKLGIVDCFLVVVALLSRMSHEVIC